VTASSTTAPSHRALKLTDRAAPLVIAVQLAMHHVEMAMKRFRTKDTKATKKDVILMALA